MGDDPVRTTRIAMICGLITLWLLVLIFLAITIWVDEYAINPAIGCAFVAVVGTIFFVPTYIKDRKRESVSGRSHPDERDTGEW